VAPVARAKAIEPWPSNRTAKSPPRGDGLKWDRDDEKRLLRRTFDLDGGAKLVLAGIANPRIMDAAFAVKLGRDRGKQHFAAARAGGTPQNASDGQTSVRCNIVTHGRPPVSQSAFTIGTLHGICGGGKTAPWSGCEKFDRKRGDLNQSLATMLGSRAEQNHASSEKTPRE
jgi:hypothetical protein